jgi:hypothetical protein
MEYRPNARQQYYENQAGHLFLSLVILATQEAEVRRLTVEASQANTSLDTFLKNPITKRASTMVQVLAHSSNPSPAYIYVYIYVYNDKQVTH